jgi:hypothetical protein
MAFVVPSFAVKSEENDCSVFEEHRNLLSVFVLSIKEVILVVLTADDVELQLLHEDRE